MDQTEQSLVYSYNLIKEGNFAEAKADLSAALASDLENEEVLYALKCLNFWNVSTLFRAPPSVDVACVYADSVLEHWNQFTDFIARDSHRFDRCLFAFRTVVFTVVAEYYSAALEARALDTDGYCKLAVCYKKLGDYDKALEFNKIANAMSPNTASILGEMADCYALCGEDQTSKVLFREAFFLDASKVDIRFFDSELFCRLLAQVQKVRTCGINELLEWIPVYGVLFGVFNVKRKLRAVEIGRLQMTIYSLENTMREVGTNEAILKPRLINHYFWLLDHYMMHNESRERINEVLLKIKILDRDIYEKYTN